MQKYTLADKTLVVSKVIGQSHRRYRFNYMVCVHLMVLGMHILGIAKFLVAGVGENIETASFTPPIILCFFLRYLS